MKFIIYSLRTRHESVTLLKIRGRLFSLSGMNYEHKPDMFKTIPRLSIKLQN